MNNFKWLAMTNAQGDAAISRRFPTVSYQVNVIQVSTANNWFLCCCKIRESIILIVIANRVINLY